MTRTLADLLARILPERRARAWARAQRMLTEMASQELRLKRLPRPAEPKTMRPDVSKEE